MRRPTLCCDHQTITDNDASSCKDQGGAFARVRRLLFPGPMARSRVSHHTITDGGSLKIRDTLHHVGSPTRGTSSGSTAAPPLRLSQTLAAVQQEMIGVPLEDLLKGHCLHGVPDIVYDLCSYILNHEVNCAALLYEDWCDSDIRATLLRNHRSKNLDCSSAAQLLRFYVEELPKPLLPPRTVTALSAIAESGAIVPSSSAGDAIVESKARRLMIRDLEPYSLRMVGYLTAFLSCLHHANRCEREGASILLSTALVGGGQSRRGVGRPLAHYLLQHCGSLFPTDGGAGGDKGNTGLLALPYSDSCSSSSTPLPSQGEDNDADSENDDEEEDRRSKEEDDDDSSSSTSSRTTTSGDTEDFRSPQLSPTRLALQGNKYVLLPDSDVLSPDEDMIVSPAEEDAKDAMVRGRHPPNPSPTLGDDDDEEDNPTLGDEEPNISPLSSSTLRVNFFSSLDAGDETDEGKDTTETELRNSRNREDSGEADGKESDTSSSARSTNNCDLAVTAPIKYSDVPKDDCLPWQSYSCRDSLSLQEESDGTSCHPLSDQGDDTTSGGEICSLNPSVDSDESPVAFSEQIGEYHMVGEMRRSSERTYYNGGDYIPSSSSSPMHGRSKRKKNRRRHSKEGGALYSSHGSSREKLSPPVAPSPQTQSDEDEDTTIIEGPSPTESKPVLDSLSDLLDHNEPAVACDRGRWASEGDNYHHRTEPVGFGRFAEEVESPQTASSRSSWHNKYDSYSSSSRRLRSSPPTDFPSSSAFMKAVTGKTAVGALQKNISALKRKIKRFEEEFERNYGYKPSHSDKMKHKDMKKYVTELNKYRKEHRMLRDGIADMMSTKGFPLSLLRCQESTESSSLDASEDSTDSTSTSNPLNPSTMDQQSTLIKVEDKLRESRDNEGRPMEISNMTMPQLQQEKTSLQKALLYYESIHGRPSTRDTREMARPLYDRYRLIKRTVNRAQSRAKENVNELAPIFEHVQMDFTLASPQHRSSLTPEPSGHLDQLLQCKEKLLAVQRKQMLQERKNNSSDEEEEDNYSDKRNQQQDAGSDSSDGKQSSTALSNLHSLPLQELKERRKEAKEQKKKLRRSLRQYEERYEREHGHKLAKEDRGIMEENYREYKHAKAKLRLLEALISKKAPKEDDY